MRTHHLKSIFLLIFILFFYCCRTQAQKLLKVPVSITAQDQKLSQVLDTIGARAGFIFSYNSDLIQGNQLVSISVKETPVEDILEQLFRGRLQYRELNNHIILQPMSSVTPYWYISGTITDGANGEKISNASVYEEEHLAGTLSNTDGSFRLPLKQKNKYSSHFAITFSIIGYKDTSIAVTPFVDQELKVSLTRIATSLAPVIIQSQVEKTWLSRIFATSKLRRQTRNIKNFIATRPVQFSFTPGLGTHGQLGAQVVNKFSFNLFGGYTAGTNGLELAGLFNINENSAQYVQVAGLFNTVGHNVKGLQIAGIHNMVFDSVSGVQVAGVSNLVKGGFSGVQMSGVVSNINKTARGLVVAGVGSRIKDHLSGWQVSGLFNFSKKVSGVQIAGIGNITTDINGFQMSGIFNKARNVRGVQISPLFNIADSSDYPIGLINWIKKGEKGIGITMDETATTLLSLRSGGRVLYGILGAGINLKNNQLYAGEAGFGAHLSTGNRFRFNTELAGVFLFDGEKKFISHTAFRIMAGYSAGKIEFFAGPTLNSIQFDSQQDNNLVPHFLWSRTSSQSFSGVYIGYAGGIQFKF